VAEDLEKLLDEQRERMAALLKHVGEPGRCKGCSAAITWVRHLDSGRNTPYDIDGLNHFASCPEAAQFKRKP
jgi:hypothetical protein